MKFLSVVLVGIFIYACETPTRLERNNPDPPDSETFIPNPPSEVTFFLRYDDVIHVSWKDNSKHEDHYVLERSINDEPFAFLAQLEANTTAFEDSAKALGTYSYRIQANGDKKDGPFIESPTIEAGHWRPGPVLHGSRQNVSMVMLQNGDVLVVSWGGESELLRIGESEWIPVGKVQSVSGLTTLLKDGRVLILGVRSAGDGGGPIAEIFNPQTIGFENGGQLKAKQFLSRGASMITLQDGRVLVTAVSDIDAREPVVELYEPDAKSFSLAPLPANYRYSHTLTPLANGEVLIAGGFWRHTSVITATCEIFDPVAMTWRKAGSMRLKRVDFNSLSLANGQVFVDGGTEPDEPSEIYDPAEDRWTVIRVRAYGNHFFFGFEIEPSKILTLTGSNNADITPSLFDINARTREGLATIPPTLANTMRFSSGLLSDNRILVVGKDERTAVFRLK